MPESKNASSLPVRHCCPDCGRPYNPPERPRHKGACPLYRRPNGDAISCKRRLHFCCFCGISFTAKQHQKFCSRECRHRHWYAANKEKVCERVRRNYADNPEKVQLAVRQWRLANPEKRRAQSRRQYAANQGKMRKKLRELNRRQRFEKTQLQIASLMEKIDERPSPQSQP